MKKKAISIFLFILLAVGLASQALGAIPNSNEITLDDLEARISIPSSFFIFTQTTDPNASVFRDMNFNPDKFLKYMKDENIYLDSFSSDRNTEILLSSKPSVNNVDFSYLSDDEITQFGKKTAESFSSKGLTVGDVSEYKNEITKYMLISYYSQTQNQNILQYTTVNYGKMYNIVLRTKRNILDSDKVLLKNAVDSLKFKEFTDTWFEDTEKGYGMVIPGGWQLSNTDIKNGFSFDLYSNPSVPSEKITVEYKDFFTEFEKLKVFSRSQLNSSNMPESLMKFFINAFVDRNKARLSDFSSININNQRFFKTKAEIKSLHDDTVFFTDIYLTISDAKYYTFIYEHPRDVTLKSEDFMKLLNSVSITSDKTPKKSFSMPYITLIIGFISILPILFYRYFINKAPIARKKAKKISNIYGASVFILILAISLFINENPLAALSVLIYSFINYLVLSYGSNKDSVPPEQ